MHVLVTGSAGLVGSAVVESMTGAGHRITRLVRTAPPSGDCLLWNPQAGKLDEHGLAGVDAVVHLAGESIAARWTKQKKERIRSSRVEGTRRLCAALARMPAPPRVLVAASAIGFYGNRDDEVLTEQSQPGTGFLPEVCRVWEAATKSASDAGIRVVNLRIGMVLAADGGALAKMLLPFRLGFGGRIGSGRQYVSWTTLEDLVGAIDCAITNERLTGPINATSPQPVTNAEFTKTLGRALRRPTLLPVPAFAARLAMGEMANDLLLSSTRVEPTKLLETGYTFHHPDLEGALRHILG